MSKEKKLVDELVDIFIELPSELKPDSRNEYQKYNYNSISQVKALVGKELKKHKILFVPQLKEVINIPIEEKMLTTTKFEFLFIKGSEQFKVESAGQAVDSQGKGLSKAKSDAIKRLFTDMFLIATSDEDDEKSYGQTNEKTEKKEFTIKEPNAPLTEAQKKAIWAISKNKGVDEEVLHASIQGLYNKKSISDLTKEEASKLISKLQTEA